MSTIWKYPVPIQDAFSLNMPQGARILSVQTQRGEPVLWAWVYPEEPLVERRFFLVGTGHPMSDDISLFSLFYVGTFQVAAGSLVFHLFEVLDE